MTIRFHNLQFCTSSVKIHTQNRILQSLCSNVYRISSKSKPKVERNPEESVNEDEDVQMEKARVKEALSCQACEEVIKCLVYKEHIYPLPVWQHDEHQSTVTSVAETSGGGE